MMRWRNSMTVLAGFCLLYGCQQPKERQPEPQAPANDQAATIPVLPVADPLLNRETLLLAVAHAASEAALGRVDESDQRRLDGKRFELRLRFGCSGAEDESADRPRMWAFDEKRRVLSLKVEPEISSDIPLVRSLDGDNYEAVEGFWLHRPWLLKAACPTPPAYEQIGAAPANPRKTTAAGTLPEPLLPRVGIAQFFTQSDARTHRRSNRAYEATKVLAEGKLPSTVGYDLVISGRLRRLSNGRVITCRSESLAAPPRCIISAQFDDVAIELPGTGEVMAKWSGA